VGNRVNMLVFLGEDVLCVVYFDEVPPFRPKRKVTHEIAEELGASKAIAMLVEGHATYVLMGAK